MPSGRCRAETMRRIRGGRPEGRDSRNRAGSSDAVMLATRSRRVSCGVAPNSPAPPIASPSALASSCCAALLANSGPSLWSHISTASVAPSSTDSSAPTILSARAKVAWTSIAMPTCGSNAFTTAASTVSKSARCSARHRIRLEPRAAPSTLASSPYVVTDTSGIDTITSTITRSLAGFATIENLTLLGAAAINGTGNALANVITGNGAANVLNGGLAADTLIGGLGDDTYVLENGADAVVDTGGADTITSTITRSLAGFATIENLPLLGSAAANGTGNGLANILTGNDAANTLNGGLAVDTLNGGLGNDTSFWRTAPTS